MQSPRIYLCSTSSLVPTQLPTMNTQNSKSVQTQTESASKPNKRYFNKFSSKQNFEKNYYTALEFLNKSHKLMNDALEESVKQCGDFKAENNCKFTIPEIPNYFCIFNLILEKNNDVGLPSNEQCGNGYDLKKRVSQESDFEDFKLWLDKTLILENNKPNKTNDAEDVNFNPDFINISKDISFYTHSKNDNVHNEKPNRKCSSELDIEYSYSLREVSSDIQIGNLEKSHSSHSTTNTKKTNKLTELIQRQIKQQVANQLLKKPIQKKRKSVNAKTLTPLVQNNFPIINIPPQMNLFEYAKRRSENIYPKNDVLIINCATTKLSKNNKTDNVVDLRFAPNSSDIPLKLKRSGTNIVNEMFKKISQESLRKPTTPSTPEPRAKTDDGDRSSDSDSVILDDDEFQKKNVESSTGKRNDCGKVKRPESITMGCKGVVDNSFNFDERSKPIKLHPLQLSDRDLSKLDNKAIKDIGLFTEKGIFRPGIFSVLQEQQKYPVSLNHKNKQFRTKRKLNVEVNFARSSVDFDESDETSGSIDEACALKSVISFCSDVKNDES